MKYWLIFLGLVLTAGCFDGDNAGWKLEFQLQGVGAGKGNVEQSFAIIPATKEVYSQRVCQQSYSCINRYPWQPGQAMLQAIDTMLSAEQLGHQGLSYQLEQNQLYFWSSVGKAYQANNGHYAIRFRYQAYQPLGEFKLYRLFDDRFQKSGSTTPAISADGRYLIARGYKNKQSVIRLWSLQALNEASSAEPTVDLSQRYQLEFSLDALSQQPEYPLQAIASDGQYLYFLLGKSSILHNKVLLTYDMQGKLLTREELTLGKQQATQESPDAHWEAEGMAIAQDRLFIMLASGKAKARINRIYSRPLSRPQP